MSAFHELYSRVAGGSGEATPVRNAPLVLTLPPSAFADTWSRKPKAPVRIGLRLLSESELTDVAAMARKYASRLHPMDGSTPADVWIEAYNASLIADALATALCEPDDVSVLWFKSTPNDTIRVAFRPATLKKLWEDYERLQKATSPLTGEATDEEIASLGATMADIAKTIANATGAQAARFRRICTFLKEEMQALPELNETEE